MEKRDAAKLLFLEGNITQKEIAKLFKVSENTISRWAKEDLWNAKKLNYDLLTDNSTQHILELIHYQTTTLKKLKDKWLEDQEYEDNLPLISKGDIDALQKLWTTIRKDARKFSDYVSIIKEFFAFLQNHKLSVAKELTDAADIFLNDVRKQL